MRARTRCEFAAVMLRAQEGTLPSEEEREGDEEDGDGNQADPGGAPPWHYRSTVSSLQPGSFHSPPLPSHPFLRPPRTSGPWELFYTQRAQQDGTF